MRKCDTSAIDKPWSGVAILRPMNGLRYIPADCVRRLAAFVLLARLSLCSMIPAGFAPRRGYGPTPDVRDRMRGDDGVVLALILAPVALLLAMLAPRDGQRRGGWNLIRGVPPRLSLLAAAVGARGPPLPA